MSQSQLVGGELRICPRSSGILPPPPPPPLLYQKREEHCISQPLLGYKALLPWSLGYSLGTGMPLSTWHCIGYNCNCLGLSRKSLSQETLAPSPSHVEGYHKISSPAIQYRTLPQNGKPGEKHNKQGGWVGKKRNSKNFTPKSTSKSGS